MIHEPDRPAIVWFRRDLRLHDQPALAAALAGHPSVIPLFVVDPGLASGRAGAPDRLWWMTGAVRALAAELDDRGARLLVRVGDPAIVLPQLAQQTSSRDVYISRDFTPYGRRRDGAVAGALEDVGSALHEHPGTYIQEPEAVHTKDGRPFSAFAPFHRAWDRVAPRDPIPAPHRIPVPVALADLVDDRVPTFSSPTALIAELLEPGEPAGRRRLEGWLRDRPSADAGGASIDAYADRRNLLAVDGTSRLSADLRWGTLSPTEVLVRASGSGDGRRAFATELVWREFYGHLLWHHPRLRTESYQTAYDRLAWRDDEPGFRAWAEGRTGVPVVDAAMRQLAATGWMHNRARMIVASFLAKDLLIDPRRGEAHFMTHLVDGDVASNGGGWQWAASTGADAQPAFRVFNPVTQGTRFDPDGAYVRRWVPELRDIPSDRIHTPGPMDGYPAPIVDHRFARQRALDAYADARRASQEPASVRRTS